MSCYLWFVLLCLWFITTLQFWPRPLTRCRQLTRPNHGHSLWQGPYRGISHLSLSLSHSLSPSLSLSLSLSLSHTLTHSTSLSPLFTSLSRLTQTLTRPILWWIFLYLWFVVFYVWFVITVLTTATHSLPATHSLHLWFIRFDSLQHVLCCLILISLIFMELTRSSTFYFISFLYFYCCVGCLSSASNSAITVPGDRDYGWGFSVLTRIRKLTRSSTTSPAPSQKASLSEFLYSPESLEGGACGISASTTTVR
jgi:hypothetical protein